MQIPIMTPGPHGGGEPICHSVAMVDRSDQARAPRTEQARRLIEGALQVLAHLTPPPHLPSFAAQKRELDAELLRQAATARGLPVTRLSPETSLIDAGAARVVVHKNMPSTLSGLDRSVTNNKHLTKRVLAAAGVPVARGRLVADVEQARAVFRQMGTAAVTKPIVGSGGRGVSVDITTEAELDRACAQISERRRHIVIEEMIAGVDLRVMTVAGRAVAATVRVPASVVGDGSGTIEELVAAKNQVRTANSYARHSPVQITAEARRHLQAQGLSPETVPASGRRVWLSLTANISGGGDHYAVTDIVHPELLHLAERAAACFPGATHTGIDLIAQRIDTGLDDQHVVVSEVNLNNEIGMHVLPMYGPPVAVHHILIDELIRVTHRTSAAGAGAGASDDERPAGPSAVRSGAARFPPVHGDQLRAWAVRHGALVSATDPDTDSTASSRTDQADPDMDADRLRQALQEGGLQDVQRRGALLFASDQGADVVLHRSGRSVVSAELARAPRTLRTLAHHLGIPWALQPGAEADSRGTRCEVLFLGGRPAATRLLLPVPPDRIAQADGEFRRRAVHTYVAVGCPAPELSYYARLLSDVIGSTPMLAVRCVLAGRGRGAPFWVLEGIDPEPVLAAFAPPGVPDQGWHWQAAQVLLRSERYRLPPGTASQIG